MSLALIGAVLAADEIRPASVISFIDTAKRRSLRSRWCWISTRLDV